MKTGSALLFASALVLLAGCGGTLSYSGDGTVDSGVDTTPTDTAIDPGVDPGLDPGTDTVGDTPIPDTIDDVPVDTPIEPPEDVPADLPAGQCNDGIDNDGDNLIDTEDFDCADPSDPLEGPEGGAGTCSVDNHCLGGWEECDRDTGACYTPPQGAVCASCYNSTNCGDGVTGEDPDRDYCVYYGSGSGECTKDCVGDFDCPRGFNCLDNDGIMMCLPRAGTCGYIVDVVGTTCSTEEDCGDWGYNLPCNAGTCTTDCVIEHDCRGDMSCVDGFCVLDA